MLLELFHDCVRDMHVFEHSFELWRKLAATFRLTATIIPASVHHHSPYQRSSNVLNLILLLMPFVFLSFMPSTHYIAICYTYYIISGLHHYKCVVPLTASNLQSGRFWAILTASVNVTLRDSRSFKTVFFIHVTRGHPGCLFQSSGGNAARIFIA